MNETGRNIMNGLIKVADGLSEENKEIERQRREDEKQSERVNQRVKDNLKKFHERLDKNE